LAQEFQRLLRAVREDVKRETDETLKKEQLRYKDATDGAWLDEREQYYKARSESLYLQRRAGLIETLFAWWSDVLRSGNGVAQRSLARAGEETAAMASKFSTAEILKRIRSLEELRDHLNRNIHEALAIEVAFLTIFISTRRR
jgi:DNA polymerase-3 subunit delta'